MPAKRISPCAQHRYRGYRDYDGARAEIAIAQRTLAKRSVAIRVTRIYRSASGTLGRIDAESERAIELDPRNFYTLQQISPELSGSASLRRYGGTFWIAL